MPFLDASPAGLAPQAAAPPDISVPTPPFGSLVDAALRRDNTVGSVVESATQPAMSPENPDYDPFANVKGYEDYASSFIDANSDEDVARIKARIDGERRRTDLLDAGGVAGLIAELVAGVADPINLIPIGGEAVSVGRRLPGIVEGALKVGRAGLLGSVGQEAVLQATQETRTLRESAVNVAAATLLSGVLGGAVGALERPLTREVAASVMRGGDVFERELSANVDGLTAPANDAGAEARFGSVGAAASRDTSLEQETFRSALGVENRLAFSSPTLRLGTSDSVEVRRLGQELADQPLDLRKNLEGIETPVSVESRIRLWQAPLAQALTAADDLFVKYRLGRDAKTADLLRIGAADVFRTPAGGKLTRDQFMEEVGRAMRRGDTSTIPEAQQAARVMRETVFDPLKERAIKAGLLPEDVSVDTALSYLTRVYNLPKIVAQRPEFERRLVDWLAGTRDSVAERVDRFQKAHDQNSAAKQRIEVDLPAKRERLDTVGPEAEKLAKEFARTDRELKAADRAHRKAFAAQQAAEERLARFTPTPDLEANDPLKKALRDIRRGGPKAPPTLTQFLRREGGLKDQGGEVSALDPNKKTHRGLIKDDGLPLDDATLKAWEAGYIGKPGEDRPDINDLLDALREDINGRPQYSVRDLDVVEYRDYLRDLERQLSDAGLDPNTMPDAEIALKFSEGGDAAFREGTPAARAKAREIAFYARRAKAEGEGIAERLKKLQERWDALKAASEDATAEAKGLKAEIADLEKRLSRHTSAVERLGKKIDDERTFAGLDTLDLQDMARQITDTLLHSAPARSLYTTVPLTRGPLRERTLSIPDKDIEDFLESDIGRVARIYTRTMGADVELASAFGRADMEEQFNKVREQYAVLRNGVTDEAKLTALDKQMRADLRDLAAVRDRIRGTYGLPENPNGLWNRAFHVTRDLNYLRLLGGMTVSALPDLGRTVMVHGLTRVFGDGLLPMVRDFGAFRLAADEVKLSGTALDMVLDSRAMSLADVLDDYGRWSKIERGLSKMTEKFGLVSLMAPWNAALKQFVGVVSQTRALRAVEALAAGGEVSAAERTRLASLGIGAADVEAIDRMFRRHGTKDSGVWWANTAAWEDTAAADVFRAAMGKEVNAAIVEPGQERPLWMTKGVGRLVGQFKAFSVASTQRVLLSGLQKRDMATLNGAALMTALGMAVYWLKTPQDRVSDNPATWIKEGVDRSGLTGWLFDANNLAEKMTGNAIGLSRLVGTPMSSRYASRNALGALLGPTAGLVQDTAGAVGDAGAGTWTAADTRAVRRMVPLQNLIGLRHLFDAAEHGVNQSLGIPETRH